MRDPSAMGRPFWTIERGPQGSAPAHPECGPKRYVAQQGREHFEVWVDTEHSLGGGWLRPTVHGLVEMGASLISGPIQSQSTRYKGGLA